MKFSFPIFVAGFLGFVNLLPISAQDLELVMEPRDAPGQFFLQELGSKKENYFLKWDEDSVTLTKLNADYSLDTDSIKFDFEFSNERDFFANKKGNVLMLSYMSSNGKIYFLKNEYDFNSHKSTLDTFYTQNGIGGPLFHETNEKKFISVLDYKKDGEELGVNVCFFDENLNLEKTIPLDTSISHSFKGVNSFYDKLNRRIIIKLWIPELESVQIISIDENGEGYIKKEYKGICRNWTYLMSSNKTGHSYHFLRTVGECDPSGSSRHYIVTFDMNFNIVDSLLIAEQSSYIKDESTPPKATVNMLDDRFMFFLFRRRGNIISNTSVVLQTFDITDGFIVSMDSIYLDQMNPQTIYSTYNYIEWINNDHILVKWSTQTNIGLNPYPGFDKFQIYKVNGLVIKDDENDDVFIYPNPTERYFKVDADAEVIDFRVWDTYGKDVSNLITLEEDFFDVSALQRGVYYLMIGDSTVKFYKQ